jgi:hypothetical protein
MSQHLQLGTVGFKGEVLPFALQRQTPPSLQTGPAIQRSGRQGVVSLVFDDFSKGFLPVSGVQRWDQSKGRVYYNQGVMLHLPGLACLPFASTAQAALAAVDISGYRALNRKVHALMSSLGSASGGRFYAFVGPNMYKDTSTSNAALIAPSVADAITNNVTATWAGKANATDYLIIGTDGQTDDVMGTADPTQNTVSWTSIVTHAHANDRAEAGWYFPQWDMNAVMGTLNDTQRIYCFPGGTATLPYTTSTVKDVVFTETKDVPNPSSTIVTYGPYYPRTVAAITGGATIVNVTNLTAADGSYATIDTASALGMLFQAQDYGLDQNIPSNLIPTGVINHIVGKEDVVAVNAYVSLHALISDATPTTVGLGKLQTLSGATEFGTGGPDTDFTFGGTQDRYGARLTISLLLQPDFGTQWSILHANTAGTLSIDYVSMYVAGILPGTTLSFPRGAEGRGPNPASATQRCILAPSRAEPTAVTVERELWLLDFAYDSEGSRLTANPTKPATGMAHVEDVCHHQGGYAVCGGSAPGPAELAKIVDSNGITRSLGFPQVNGATAVRITSMVSANTALMVWTCNADATDAQLWIFIDGAWNAYGALFSKTLGGAMSTLPLAWAERTMGTTNRNIYNFYPTTTNTSVMRQFVPTDVLTDPFLTNTTQVKQDGPLYFETLELDVMPEEALKAFTGMEVQSRRVDDNTSYGSVNWKVDTGGDHGFSVAEIDQTFDAAAETYTLRAFSSSNDPGVAYKTAIFRCTLGHQTATSETPNALPTLFYISADWKPLQRFSVMLDTVGQSTGPVDLAKKVRDLFVAKNVARFQGEGQDIPVKLDIERGGYNLTFKNTTLGKMQPTWDDVTKFEIYLQECEGAIS